MHQFLKVKKMKKKNHIHLWIVFIIEISSKMQSNPLQIRLLNGWLFFVSLSGPH